MAHKDFVNYDIVMDYAQSIIDGRKVANVETKQMAERFFKDLENPNYDFNPQPAEFVIGIVEKTIKHQKGVDKQGVKFRGKPLLLEPWQKFIVYNLLGFYKKGTTLRRFSEAFIMIARKNGKTPFIAALAWGIALLESVKGVDIVIVGALLKHAMYSFDFLHDNLVMMGEFDPNKRKREPKGFKVLNNTTDHSIRKTFKNGGYLRIDALAGNSDRLDGLNTSIQILDELHLFKSAAHYETIQESGSADPNSMTIGITTAGHNTNSFAYNHMKTCQQILNGSKDDESMFVFIAKSDEDEDGNVDYTNPVEHEKANPNYNVSISAEKLMDKSIKAQNDPARRMSFLAKHLNKYTAAMEAYFDIIDFQNSNDEVDEKLKLNELTLDQKLDKLSKLPIKWYGGADLSKMLDLTAAAIYGTYKDIDIVISHAFFPIAAAVEKQKEDNIPLFGWKEDGWLTTSNGEFVSYPDVVNWFKAMRDRGFTIAQVGYDVKFGREFYLEMKKAKFRIQYTPQQFHNKSEGFRRIEYKAKTKNFYYLGSQAFEYCVQNVKAIEQTDDAMKFEKVMPTARIDVFDASVFASMQMLKNLTKADTASGYVNSKQ